MVFGPKNHIRSGCWAALTLRASNVPQSGTLYIPVIETIYKKEPMLGTYDPRTARLLHQVQRQPGSPDHARIDVGRRGCRNETGALQDRQNQLWESNQRCFGSK